jgi:hypothetical protein
MKQTLKITIPDILIKQQEINLDVEDTYLLSTLERDISFAVSKVLQETLNNITSKGIKVKGPLGEVHTKVDNRSNIETRVTDSPILTLWNKATADPTYNYLFSSSEIVFGDKYHSWLVQLNIYPRIIFSMGTASLIQMYELGLLENDDISKKGWDTLNTLRELGPKSKGIVRKVKTVTSLATLVENKFYPVNISFGFVDWLKYKNYITGFSCQCIEDITDIGRKYMEDNVGEVLESKFYMSNYSNYINYLVPFLSIKLLPTFISSDNKYVRELAQKRFDELKGES